jgi:hypothetical protein
MNQITIFYRFGFRRRSSANPLLTFFRHTRQRLSKLTGLAQAELNDFPSPIASFERAAALNPTAAPS